MSSNKKRIQTGGRTAATPGNVEEDSDEDSKSDRSVARSIARRARGQAGPKTPVRISQDAGRPQRRPSDTVDDVHPGRPIRRTTFGDGIEEVYKYTPHKEDEIYKYEPLKEDEIRLLIVKPGSPGQEIRCFLIHERLQDSRPFQALSYRWGDDVSNKPIIILTPKSVSSKSEPLPRFRRARITTKTNLFEALQQLRHREHDVTLYVSALCIDYDNGDEKYPQSARTQEIFNKASDVIVWLGTENTTSETVVKNTTTKTAFDFIENVLDMNSFDKLVKKEFENDQGWDALAELMRNSLFSRRWLIQELAAAKNAELHCGPHTVQWTDFSDAVALFEANFPEIQKSFKFSYKSGGPINDIRAFGASTLVSVVNNIIRKTPDGKILNRLHGVETLVSILAVFEATDPLDTINAVMGLAKDEAKLKSKIDGRRRILDNYIDFVAHCVESSQSIDIICRHWAPAQSTNVRLPSWIPSVSGSAFGAPKDKDKDTQSGRVNGDSFVGLPSHRIYNASLGFPAPEPLNAFGRNPNPDKNIPAKFVQYDGTMTVEGFLLCPITDPGPRTVSGIIQREQLEMGGWFEGSQSVPERLWRTLVADRGPNNTNPPSWYNRACLHVLQHLSGANGDIKTESLLKQPKLSHIVADFLRRVQSVIWNRKFFQSEKEVGGERLFGLVPGETKAGDMVCVLYGCSVPVVLREHKMPEDHYFEVIGESFVYGMMDGEANQGLTEEQVVANTKSYKLR